jgi:hypothetical protein
MEIPSRPCSAAVFLVTLSKECGQAVGHRKGVGAIAFDHAQDQDLAFEVYVFPLNLRDTASARKQRVSQQMRFTGERSCTRSHHARSSASHSAQSLGLTRGVSQAVFGDPGRLLLLEAWLQTSPASGARKLAASERARRAPVGQPAPGRLPAECPWELTTGGPSDPASPSTRRPRPEGGGSPGSQPALRHGPTVTGAAGSDRPDPVR